MEELDPSSIDADGAWLEEVEAEAREALGEAADHLLAISRAEQAQQTTAAASPPATTNEQKRGSQGTHI